MDRDSGRDPRDDARSANRERPGADPRDRRPRRIEASRAEYRRQDGGRTKRGRKERSAELLRDVAVWRTVAYRDLVNRHFDGHHFAGRRTIDGLVAKGWLETGRGDGSKGGGFLTVTATALGRSVVDERLRTEGGEGLRTWHGRAKRRETVHDCAAYRATMLAADRIRAEGGTVLRIRTEAELKSCLARASELARVRDGKLAADRERLAEAARLGLPVKAGRVLVPDAQIEYTGMGGMDVAKAHIEVTTDNYSKAQVAAKAAAGFTLTATGMGGAGKRALAAAIGSGGGGGGGGGGGRKGGDAFEELEW